jgi:hypothetical protein
MMSWSNEAAVSYWASLVSWWCLDMKPYQELLKLFQMILKKSLLTNV